MEYMEDTSILEKNIQTWYSPWLFLFFKFLYYELFQTDEEK